MPLFRYSRDLWLYIDWQLDPVHEVEPALLPPIVARAWVMPTPNRPWTHDSLFALTQRLAMLIDPVFDRTLPHRAVEPIEGRERAAWGTERFGLLGERTLPLPGEVIRRRQSFSAYGLARDQQLSRQRRNTTGKEPSRVLSLRPAPHRPCSHRSIGCSWKHTGQRRCHLPRISSRINACQNPIDNRDNLPRRVIAVLLQRCPRCLNGHVYHGLVAMHETCPRCGYLVWARTRLFHGRDVCQLHAGRADLVCDLHGAVAFLLHTWPLTFNLLVTFVVFLPFVPIIFRYSRVIWMHVDWKLDPGKQL